MSERTRRGYTRRQALKYFSAFATEITIGSALAACGGSGNRDDKEPGPLPTILPPIPPTQMVVVTLAPEQPPQEEPSPTATEYPFTNDAKESYEPIFGLEIALNNLSGNPLAGISEYKQFLDNMRRVHVDKEAIEKFRINYRGQWDSGADMNFNGEVALELGLFRMADISDAESVVVHEGSHIAQLMRLLEASGGNEQEYNKLKTQLDNSGLGELHASWVGLKVREADWKITGKPPYLIGGESERDRLVYLFGLLNEGVPPFSNEWLEAIIPDYEPIWSDQFVEQVRANVRNLNGTAPFWVGEEVNLPSYASR